jgi:hypothetical protein
MGELMDTQITVATPSEDHISFGDFTFGHDGCAQPHMSKYRNPATNQYTLRCNCGLELTFENQGAAMGAFVDSVISREPMALPPGTFMSDKPRHVVVRPIDSA